MNRHIRLTKKGSLFGWGFVVVEIRVINCGYSGADQAYYLVAIGDFLMVAGRMGARTWQVDEQ
jgi:hypothetical protein